MLTRQSRDNLAAKTVIKSAIGENFPTNLCYKEGITSRECIDLP